MGIFLKMINFNIIKLSFRRNKILLMPYYSSLPSFLLFVVNMGKLLRINQQIVMYFFIL